MTQSMVERVRCALEDTALVSMDGANIIRWDGEALARAAIEALMVPTEEMEGAAILTFVTVRAPETVHFAGEHFASGVANVVGADAVDELCAVYRAMLKAALK